MKKYCQQVKNSLILYRMKIFLMKLKILDSFNALVSKLNNIVDSKVNALDVIKKIKHNGSIQKNLKEIRDKARS